MPHIELPAGFPGIRRNANLPGQTLSMGHRELIAAYVPALNDCYFCQTIHGAVASYHLGGYTHEGTYLPNPA